MKISLIIIFLFFSINIFAQGNDFKEGMSYYNSKNFAKAIEKFQSALLKDSKNPEIMFYLANSYSAEKEYELAINYLKNAFTNTQYSNFKSFISYNIGYNYFLLNQYEKAIENFEISYNLNKANIQNLKFIGLCYYQLKNKDKVIENWKNYVKVAPDGADKESIIEALKLISSDDFSFDDKNKPQSQTPIIISNQEIDFNNFILENRKKNINPFESVEFKYRPIFDR